MESYYTGWIYTTNKSIFLYYKTEFRMSLETTLVVGGTRGKEYELVF